MQTRMHRVVDPQHVHPIYAVEVLAGDADHAKKLALEAMMGCPVGDVDEKVVRESLASLTVEEMPQRAGRTAVTFEEFQNAKEWCDDLNAPFPDDVLLGSKGWVYASGQLWIEDTATWSADAPGYGAGRWYLRIANFERQSDDLTELEKLLYAYAKSEEFVS